METKRNEVEKFHHTVGVLVKAYLNETLVNGNACACAVGNLIAEANNYKFVKCIDDTGKKIVWDISEGKYHSGNFPKWFGFIRMNAHREEAMTEINSTGYSLNEIILIEKAFEKAEVVNPDRQFNGLMAVVDILAEIHGIELQAKESAKALFVKA